MAKDPVCNMECDPQTAAARSVYMGKTYYFCALPCKREFDKHPEQYAGSEAKPKEKPQKRAT